MKPGQRVRVVDTRDVLEAVRGSRECEARGCLRTTRRLKPFCTEHVSANPYAATVAEELGRRERAAERARRAALRSARARRYRERKARGA